MDKYIPVVICIVIIILVVTFVVYWTSGIKTGSTNSPRFFTKGGKIRILSVGFDKLLAPGPNNTIIATDNDSIWELIPLNQYYVLFHSKEQAYITIVPNSQLLVLSANTCNIALFTMLATNSNPVAYILTLVNDNNNRVYVDLNSLTLLKTKYQESTSIDYSTDETDTLINGQQYFQILTL